MWHTIIRGSLGLALYAVLMLPGHQATAQPMRGAHSGFEDSRDYRHYWRSYLRELRACFKASARQLQVLHSSDNESSFQDPNTLEEKLLNYSAIVEGLQSWAEDACVPSLHITAGDHTIPGPFYRASTEVDGLGQPGLADILTYNAMGLTANGMGNHEFDGGIDEFAHMLNVADYPFIAANLDFSAIVLAEDSPEIQVGQDAGFCEENRGKVVRSCWTAVGLQRVGLIGRAPADFFNVIEDPENTLGGLDFVGGRDPATNQPLISAVDQVLEQVLLLEQQGVNRIILIDHAQDFTGDPLSANLLRGIDIVVAAGTTGFMAQPEADGPFNLLRPEDQPEADYPTIRSDSEGGLVLVVNSDQQYRYVGQLVVHFDRWGRIRRIDDRSGPIATTEEGVLALEEVIERPVTPNTDVLSTFTALSQTPSIMEAFTEVGVTDTPLNGQRADVRSRETNLGQLAADSTIWAAEQEFPDLGGVDVALKNGGGIRDTIQGPVIIRLSIQAALAFDNKLSVLELTAEQLLATMENSVSRVPALDGRFPQVAGMFMEFDASKAPLEGLTSVTTPSRVKTLIIERADGSMDTLVDNFVAQGDLFRTFVLATNSFLTTGGDGYASLAASTRLAETSIGEQQILENYIIEELGASVVIADPVETSRVVRLD